MRALQALQLVRKWVVSLALVGCPPVASAGHSQDPVLEVLDVLMVLILVQRVLEVLLLKVMLRKCRWLLPLQYAVQDLSRLRNRQYIVLSLVLSEVVVVLLVRRKYRSVAPLPVHLLEQSCTWQQQQLLQGPWTTPLQLALPLLQLAVHLLKIVLYTLPYLLPRAVYWMILQQAVAEEACSVLQYSLARSGHVKRLPSWHSSSSRSVYHTYHACPIWLSPAQLGRRWQCHTCM